MERQEEGRGEKDSPRMPEVPDEEITVLQETQCVSTTPLLNSKQFTVDTGNGHIYTSKHLPQYSSDTKISSVFLFLNIKAHFSYTVYLHTSRL